MNADNFDRTDPVTGKDTDSDVGILFVAEAAELGLRAGHAPPRDFLMANCPVKGMNRAFRADRTDMSGGDIAGWRYVEADGPNKGNTSWQGEPSVVCEPYRVLIIND